MRKMIILTDNIYFQCAEVRSLCCYTHTVQNGWSVNKDGMQEPKFKEQYQINIQYDMSEDDPNKVHLRGGPAVMSLILSSKKECKAEMKSILRQIQKQRRDDAALIDAFEEHFGGEDGDKKSNSND